MKSGPFAVPNVGRTALFAILLLARMSMGAELWLQPGINSDMRQPPSKALSPNSASLAASISPVTGYVVRVAYVIPSNRTAQSNGVSNLRSALIIYQDWYRDQMSRNGFGPKTFRFETESDGVTPKVYTVNVSQTDDYLRGDLWDRTISAASAAGVPVWTPKQVWWLIPEAHLQTPDGDITGGVALGASFGSGDDAGVSMNASHALTRLLPSALTNDAPYHNQIIPELGPYPLQQDISFPGFEGTTFSSISSSSFGAGIHETSHGFGLAHDFRNDQNFKGNLMGNGLRGMRGSLYPERYPSDFTRASYASALALMVSRYFNPDATYTDNTKPTLTISTTGTNTPVNGMIRIDFTTSDAGGLHAALLQVDGDVVGEMSLSGASTNATFLTPYFTPAQTNKYTVSIFDLQGNKRTADTSIVPRTGFNRAPQPLITVSTRTAVVGQDVVLSAASSTDDGGISSVQVEWDPNGDGAFDTSPTTTKSLTTQYATAGDRLIRARLTDTAGAQSISTPIPLRVVLPTLNVSRTQNAVQIFWTTNAGGFVLEHTADFSAQWQTATQAVNIFAGQKTISITNPVGSEFFRLAR